MVGRKRSLITLFVICSLLFATAVTPAYAAFVTVYEESYTQSFDAADNNHAYIYVENDLPGMVNVPYLAHEQDIGFDTYSYSELGWSTTSGGFMGPAERYYNLVTYNMLDTGWLGSTVPIPGFYDFSNTTDDDLDLTHRQERRTFPLSVGAESSIVLEAGLVHQGMFNITDEEFIHMTLTSHQDECMYGFYVFDHESRLLTSYLMQDGNIGVVPFRPSGNGTYSLVIITLTEGNALITLDILLSSVTPEPIGYGELVEGTLTGTEWLVKSDNGEIVHEEKVPDIVTYEFSSNWTHPGMLHYSLNEQELDAGDTGYEPIPTTMLVTSDTWVETKAFSMGNEYTRYGETLSNQGSKYFYQSFQNETYFISLIGGEGTTYQLYNNLADADMVPTNEEFFIENIYSTEYNKAFRLSLSQDSVLKVNSTEGMPGFNWRIFSVFDDMTYREMSISDTSTFHAAPSYYLPAGNYIVEGACSSFWSFGHYEFNLGPVLDGAGNVAVDTGALVGVRVPTETLSFYNANITLLTHDNVTVSTDFDIFTQFGKSVVAWDADLGNRQFGVGWQAFGNNWTAQELGMPTSYDMFPDGNAIVILSPYQVLNNTGGLGGNEYYQYTVDYNLAFDEYSDDLFNDTGALTVSTTPDIYNFTLGDPGDSEEVYMLDLSVPVGTWMNVSVFVEDVTSWSAFIYQDLSGFTQGLRWSELDDNFVGDYTEEGAFQFGSISEDIIIVFIVDRQLADEGSLDVMISPFTTNTYTKMPAPMFPQDAPTGGSVGAPLDVNLLLIGGGIVVVVVVVVAAIAYRRRSV